MCDKIMCSYDECDHFFNLDDGEDENGYPYPPNPYCDAADEFLQEDGQECVAPDKKTQQTQEDF